MGKIRSGYQKNTMLSCPKCLWEFSAQARHNTIKERYTRGDGESVLLGHLKAGLTVVEAEWLTSDLLHCSRKRKRRNLEWMTEEEYTEAGESFDMSTLCFKSSTVAQDDLDEEILRAESALLQLI